MILSRSVNIPIDKKNFKFYLKKGYDPKIGVDLTVNIDDLTTGSSVMVDVECDYCFSKKKLSYKNYNKNIKVGYRYSCSQKCSYLKKSEILLKEKGVSNIFQLQETKDKIKQTNIEKWGKEHYTQTEDFKEKYRNTSFANFGVENPMMSKEIQSKVKLTSLDKWGGIGFASEEISKKIKQKNLEVWGYESISNISEIKNKSKETNLKKWGGIGYQSKEISKKIKKTLYEKYGTDSNTKNEEFRKSHYKLSKENNYLEYLGDGVSLFNCDKGHTFSIHKNNYISRKIYDIPLCTVCNPIGELSSFKEKELLDFIKSLNIEYVESYRDGLEIDIYLPEFKIGIEFNGLYWHSDLFKDKKYHLDKTNHFKDRGIRIIHVWEDDWNNKKEIIKSQIINFINLSEKIWARKCEVKRVGYSESIHFLNENHIQGSYSSFKESIGLYLGEELVCLMTFDQFEGRKKMNDDEWNLSRFCNKLNYSVIGGASKILTYFVKNFKPYRIISYSDSDWSNGKLYETLNFNKISETKPDYKYIIKKKRVHKSSFRKSKTGISESDLNIPKIWDCGKMKFEIIIKDKNI